MLNEMERERKIAQHLFYVSLKYTKTGDVILNLLIRWEKVIDKGIEIMLKKAKKQKKISEIPVAPRAKELAVRSAYKEELVNKVMDLYNLFRKIPTLEKVCEHEFRKNVTVKIITQGYEMDINIDKLKEWNELIEKFILYIIHVAKSK